MRNYKNLPDANTQIAEFNQYLKDNNEVLYKNSHWILIKNSYIENQLVLFYRHKASYLYEISATGIMNMDFILKEYKDKQMYINSIEEKSVPNRFHLHIKI